MNRKVACLVLVIACICAGSVARVAGSAGVRSEQKTVYYRSDLRILVDGRPTTLDVEPFIIDPGWIMVPVESISKELGGTVSWDDATSTLSITSGHQPQVVPAPTPQSDRQPGVTTSVKTGQTRDSVAVVIAYSDAFPQYGLGSADVVWEVMVAPGATRLLAVFTKDVDKVGPVRSLRPQLLSIAACVRN